MKISELVKLRDHITQTINGSKINQDAFILHQTLNSIDLLQKDHHETMRDLLSSIENIYHSTNDAFNKLEVFRQSVSQQIEVEIEKNRLATLQLHQPEFLPVDRTDTFIVPLEVEEVLLGRIRKYSDWHYPTVEFSPGKYSKHLVGGDPLYLVEFNHDLLPNVLVNFTNEYSNRVITYKLNWTPMCVVPVPTEQTGFIFCWNVLNYYSLYNIQFLLTTSYTLLRPGGTMLFSYNNCDTYYGAAQAEQRKMSLMSEQKIISICKSRNFEIKSTFNFASDNHSVSWIEIQKPGILTTTKAHQTLGSVKDISNQLDLPKYISI